MKKIAYLFLALAVGFAACSKEEAAEHSPEKGDVKVTFRLNLPEFSLLATRADYEDTVTDMSLLVFGSDGRFIKRCHYDGLTNVQPGARQLEAYIPPDSRYIHFVANYPDWGAFDDAAMVGKSENEIIPPLTCSGLVFWGRHEIVNIKQVQSANLYRNQAKVTVVSEANNFKVGGYALCLYNMTGTVAPFNPGKAEPFAIVDGEPTMPAGLVLADQGESECNNTPKFMCENVNFYTKQTCVIIRRAVSGQADQFYKVQLLDKSGDPYAIMRNCHYKVIIKSFDDIAAGSPTFADAKNAEPSNNVYAEVIKESPTVKDKEGNELTVSPLNILMTEAGRITVQYSYKENGVLANSAVVVAQNSNEILTNIVNNALDGTITFDVAAVAQGQKEAQILVKAGKLSRTITVVSSERYQFTPVSIPRFHGIDYGVALTFNIPDDVPGYMLPLQCLISTGCLYPVEPNKNMLVVFENSTYKYTYLAERSGLQTVHFKSSFADRGETIRIENPYFKTGTVELVSQPHWNFNAARVNTNNLAVYGSDQEVVLHFTVPADSDLPLEVVIGTRNLKTTQASAIDGGYRYTATKTGAQSVRFTSKMPDSAETITLSADWYEPANVPFEVYLAQDIDNIGGIIKRASIFGDDLKDKDIESSHPAIVPNFKTTSDSRYDNIVIKKGARLSDQVTLSYTAMATYDKTLSVRDILKQELITLKN